MVHENFNKEFPFSPQNFLDLNLQNLEESKIEIFKDFINLTKEIGQMEVSILEDELNILSCFNKGDVDFYLFDYFNALKFFLRKLDNPLDFNYLYLLLNEIKLNSIASDSLNQIIANNQFLLDSTAYNESKDYLIKFVRAFLSVEYLLLQKESVVSFNDVITVIRFLEAEYLKISEKVKILRELYGLMNESWLFINQSLGLVDSKEAILKLTSKQILELNKFDVTQKAIVRHEVERIILYKKDSAIEALSFINKNIQLNQKRRTMH